MKLYLVVLALLIPATPGCTDDPGSVCGAPHEAALLAGRTIRVGSVTVANSEDALYVLLAAADGWLLTESHVAAGSDPAELPQTRSGNPAPGRFPAGREYRPPARQDLYAFPLSAFRSSEIVVAVHAAVVDDAGRRESAWAEGEPFPGRNWAMYVRYTVHPCGPPSLAGLFRTHTQDSWGGAPAGENAAGYLAARFDSAFPQGLRIGAPEGRSVLFTSAPAILDFLPQRGAPAPLARSEVNPRDLQNSLAGETTALTLNVVFDQADPAFAAASVPLADLVVADPASPFHGWRVSQVLDAANRILAGTWTGLSPEAAAEAARRINENFENGEDRGFLRLP